MTPKEKAKELISMFTFLKPPEDDAKFYNPKQCALICVDEIIKTDPQKVEYIGDRIDPLIYEKFTRGNTKYWQEVKQELLKQ